MEEATNGTLQMSYIHDFTTPTGLVLADIAGTDPSTGAARYYYHDNIDSTRRLRGANKASLAQYEFDPYGLYYAVSGAETPYKWGPYRLDTSNAMYYTPNRWYVPMQGRWLTRDPLGMVDGPNIYSYVRANPINFIDPMGTGILCDIICHGLCLLTGAGFCICFVACFLLCADPIWEDPPPCEDPPDPCESGQSH